MLFSEPKIPQSTARRATTRSNTGFSALQRAENSSIRLTRWFRCRASCVSVLFSEPKIPQLSRAPGASTDRPPFQCSSASRKFLNFAPTTGSIIATSCFSALQRAENSSMRRAVDPHPEQPEFQCSSASRKFLNSLISGAFGDCGRASFSALQRAENSSIGICFESPHCGVSVSVLFSEPKIPQFWIEAASALCERVSVLFSEPKIPQSSRIFTQYRGYWSFSALQRAENSSIAGFWFADAYIQGFSALQRAENSSMEGAYRRGRGRAGVSVLFSEPKIPQSA